MKRTEHTQKWLDALRGGEYNQITTILMSPTGFCCIGLAAHLVSPGDECYEVSQTAMGLSEDEMWSLIHLNDGIEGQRKHSFPEIADAIEEMLEQEVA